MRMAIPAVRNRCLDDFMTDNLDLDDDMDDFDSESEIDIDGSGEIVYAQLARHHTRNTNSHYNT